MDLADAEQKFREQHREAIRRGKEWKLTFEDWLSFWQQSGKWEQRGKCRGQYVMARKGDKGAYEVGNIECVTAEQNHSDAHANKRIDLAKIAKAQAMAAAATRKQVQTPNGIFPSVKEAAASHNVSGQTLQAWLRNNKSGYHYIKAN